jgi:hypothetical protein
MLCKILNTSDIFSSGTTTDALKTTAKQFVLCGLHIQHLHIQSCFTLTSRVDTPKFLEPRLPSIECSLSFPFSWLTFSKEFSQQLQFLTSHSHSICLHLVVHSTCLALPQDLCMWNSTCLSHLFFFLLVPKFELRALHFLGQCSTSWATPQVLTHSSSLFSRLSELTITFFLYLSIQIHSFICHFL